MDARKLFSISIFYDMGGETLEEVAWRNCGCLFPGSIQGQVGWAFDQPGLVEGVSAHDRGVGLDNL